MSNVGENIKFFRKRLGMTQQEFADRLDIKRSLVGAYEEGRADPRITNLVKISSVFNLKIDDLVEIEFNKMSAIELDRFMEEGGYKKFKILTVSVDKDNRENIELIPQKAAAGYMNGYADPEFIQELPRFRLPFLPESGTFRAFEIAGDSMLPIKSGTIVIGSYVEHPGEIKNGDTYVLVTRSEGIVFKRVFNYIDEKGKIYLVSDNRSFAPFELEQDEIIELWEAKAYISIDLTDPNLESSGLSLTELSAMVNELKDEVTRIKKGNR